MSARRVRKNPTPKHVHRTQYTHIVHAVHTQHTHTQYTHSQYTHSTQHTKVHTVHTRAWTGWRRCWHGSSLYIAGETLQARIRDRGFKRWTPPRLGKRRFPHAHQQRCRHQTVLHRRLEAVTVARCGGLRPGGARVKTRRVGHLHLVKQPPDQARGIDVERRSTHHPRAARSVSRHVPRRTLTLARCVVPIASKGVNQRPFRPPEAMHGRVFAHRAIDTVARCKTPCFRGFPWARFFRVTVRAKEIARVDVAGGGNVEWIASVDREKKERWSV